MIFKRDKRIFLDFAGTTSTDKRVIKKMTPFFDKFFANPLSMHQEGIFVERAIDKARQNIATNFGVKKEEIIFTSGATEANNLGIIGFLKTFPKNKKIKILISPLEHSSVLAPLENFKKENPNLEIEKIAIDKKGNILIDDFKRKLNQDVVLISVMYANNEIGVLNNLREISSEIKKFKNKNNLFFDQAPYLHSDLGQAPLFFDINFDRLGIHLASLDGSKICGPKGIGVFIKKSYVPLEKIIYGGGQENGLRPGTENVPGIIGIDTALEIALEKKQTRKHRCLKLQKYFFEKLTKNFPTAKIIGDIEKRLPNNVNICFPLINSEFLTIQLDEIGIACSPMTTCKNVSEIARSHVVDEIDNNCGASSLRFTFDADLTYKQVDFVIQSLKKFIKN
jgi:cysteine desulfurase